MLPPPSDGWKAVFYVEQTASRFSVVGADDPYATGILEIRNEQAGHRHDEHPWPRVVDRW
jgi:hypothetical protein